MLNYDLAPEQNVIRQSVREFAEQEIAPRARELDQNEKFSVELTKKMGKELGVFGMFLPEKYGGAGMDYISYIIAVEEVARVDGSQAATIAAANSLGIGPIYNFGTEEQKMEWLPQLCSGDGLAAFGLTEANAGSDAQASVTSARLKDGEWTINGSKIFITNASTSMSVVCTVQAITGIRQDGHNELSCILVPNGVEGFTAKVMKGKMMWRASNTSELYFDDCKVPEENMLGNRGDGFKQMLKTLDAGRLSIAAMGLGGAQGAYEKALRYSQQRIQFGRPISRFQATAFKLADCAMEIECARNLLYKACWFKMQGREYSKLAAMAKLYCSEVMSRVVNHAVQIHGGYGLMNEYDVERFYRDQKLLEIGEGTSEVQRIIISRHIGCR